MPTAKSTNTPKRRTARGFTAAEIAAGLDTPAIASTQADDASRKLKSDLQNLDTQVKSGDPQKAELALAQARKDEAAAEAERQKKSASQGFPAISTYA